MTDIAYHFGMGRVRMRFAPARRRTILLRDSSEQWWPCPLDFPPLLFAWGESHCRDTAAYIALTSPRGRILASAIETRLYVLSVPSDPTRDPEAARRMLVQAPTLPSVAGADNLGAVCMRMREGFDPVDDFWNSSFHQGAYDVFVESGQRVETRGDVVTLECFTQRLASSMIDYALTVNLFTITDEYARDYWWRELWRLVTMRRRESRLTLLDRARANAEEARESLRSTPWNLSPVEE